MEKYWIFGAIAFCVAVFILRTVSLWYFRINDQIEIQQGILNELKRIGATVNPKSDEEPVTQEVQEPVRE